MLFEIAIRASQGDRKTQEDTALSWPCADDACTPEQLPQPEDGRAVAVLCDGMGGHRGGAVASRLACAAFLPLAAASSGEPRRRLFNALEQANAAIAAKIAEVGAYRGMGSTLVGVDLGPDGLTWVSVGDSLLYLWRRGAVATLNADHSLAPEIDRLAEAGKISWQDALSDPRRHYLRSALTGDEIEMIDLAEQSFPLEVGDVIVLASDGIHTLDDEQIAAIIGRAVDGGADLVARRLVGTVDAANIPHQDNTTVIAIRVRAVSPEPGSGSGVAGV